MSKKNKNDSLFKSINKSELATLSGGKNQTGAAGNVGHTIGKGDVTDGEYKAGSSGGIRNGK